MWCTVMKIKWTGYVSRMEDLRNTYLHALGKPEDALRLLSVEGQEFYVWTVVA